MTTFACVARFGGIGDNFIASAVLPGLKKKFDRVEVVTQTPQGIIFDRNPNIDKLTLWEPNHVPHVCGSLDWQLWFENFGKSYDFFRHLSHSVEMLGALPRGSTWFWWGAEMRRKLCGRSYLEVAADICEIPYCDLRPGFFPTEAELQAATELKTKVGPQCVGWVLSGSRPDKIYPYASVVVARIIRELGLPVILFGAPGRDEEIAKLIETNIKIQHGGALDGFHIALPNDKNAWALRTSLSQIQLCDLVIGPDTGAMWSVAAEAMPKIMLVSHASAENITKRWVNTTTLEADPARVPCFSCHRLHDDPSTCVSNEWNSGAACISDITADRLYETAAQIWSAGT